MDSTDHVYLSPSRTNCYGLRRFGMTRWPLRDSVSGYFLKATSSSGRFPRSDSVPRSCHFRPCRSVSRIRHRQWTDLYENNSCAKCHRSNQRSGRPNSPARTPEDPQHRRRGGGVIPSLRPGWIKLGGAGWYPTFNKPYRICLLSHRNCKLALVLPTSRKVDRLSSPLSLKIMYYLCFKAIVKLFTVMNNKCE